MDGLDAASIAPLIVATVALFALVLLVAVAIFKLRSRTAAKAPSDRLSEEAFAARFRAGRIRQG